MTYVFPRTVENACGDQDMRASKIGGQKQWSAFRVLLARSSDLSLPCPVLLYIMAHGFRSFLCFFSSSP